MNKKYSDQLDTKQLGKISRNIDKIVDLLEANREGIINNEEHLRDEISRSISNYIHDSPTIFSGYVSVACLDSNGCRPSTKKMTEEHRINRQRAGQLVIIQFMLQRSVSGFRKWLEDVYCNQFIVVNYTTSEENTRLSTIQKDNPLGFDFNWTEHYALAKIELCLNPMTVAEHKKHMFEVKLTTEPLVAKGEEFDSCYAAARHFNRTVETVYKWVSKHDHTYFGRLPKDNVRSIAN